MKKLRFLLLAAIVLATLVVFSLSANAAVIASGNCGDKGSNVKYSLDDNGTLTFYGSGKIKDIDGWDDKTFVGSIWGDSQKVKSILVKDGITEIGSGAFASFYNVESATIADSVTKIGASTFVYDAKLKYVKLPAYITEIAPTMFWGCSDLESIDIPRGVTIIRKGAFRGSGLKTVAIPNGVTVIEAEAFCNCRNLESIILPDSLTTVGRDAFRSVKFKALHLPANVINIENSIVSADVKLTGDCFKVVDGVTFSKDMKVLIRYPVEKNDISYSIPDGVEIISSFAFYGNTYLKDVIIPTSVKTMCVGSTVLSPVDYACYIGGGPNIASAFEGIQLENMYIYSMEVDAFHQGYDWFAFAKNVYILKDSKSDKSIKNYTGTIYVYPGMEYVYTASTPATVHYFTPHTHSYTSDITKSPTCTSTGTKKFTCACGDTYFDTIPANGHTCDKWFVIVPAKAGAEGKECGICNVCGAVAIRSIAALPKDRPVFRLTSAETENGYAVTLSLENNVNGFYSLDIMLKYDTAKLKCVKTDTTNAVAKFEAGCVGDTILVNYADTAFFANKGELCTMYFELVEDIPTGNTEVVINTVVSENPYTAVNCTINLEEEIAPETTTIIMTIGQAAGFVSGKAFALDAAPIIRNDRTMLPVRFVAEAFGAEVGWDGATSTATVKTEDTEIAITIGANTAIVNGEEVTLDSPAFIENSRTYLPVRFVAEKLGASVQWDGASSTATLTK